MVSKDKARVERLKYATLSLRLCNQSSIGCLKKKQKRQRYAMPPNTRYSHTICPSPSNERVRQYSTAIRRLDIRTRLLSCCPNTRLLVLSEGLLRVIERLVDNTAHALLAMIAVDLTAIIPEWFFRLNLEREHIRCLAGGCWEVETGEDTAAERLARSVEGRLSDGVVLGEEVELDVVSDFCDDVLGLEVKTIILGCGAGVNAMDDAGFAKLRGGGGCEAEDEGRCGEKRRVGDHDECRGGLIRLEVGCCLCVL